MGDYRTPQTWHRIEELLDDVLELEPTQRTAFLDDLSGSDVLFRPRLEEILRSSPEANRLLDQPVLERASDDVGPGSQLGVYRIVGLLGKGGMGEVFEAHRDDGVYEMKVAIKLLSPDQRHPSLVRRFHTERQILADLVHPNIARLHDGGTTDNGRPYLVMEHIDGVRIDAYCDQHRLSIRERLRLFRKVCEAVDFAHRQGVVHRDIKPSNILVDGDGEPKLLDFGIAKILDTAQRSTGRQPLTLEYAAPEQFGDNVATTSLDVFSLGAVLYELITGHRYRPETLVPPVDKTEKPSVVVQKKVDDPSGTITPESVSQPRKASPGHLQSLLSGDLDSIVLRTVQGKPEDRYASVYQMLLDIDRHLAGLPVEARSHESFYRLRRFAMYYRRQVAVTALCAGLILLAILGFYRNHQAQQASRHNFALTQAALDVFQVKEPIAPNRRQVSAQELLGKALQQLDASAEQSPLVGLIGSFYVGLGDYATAQPILEQALNDIDRDHPLWNYFQFDLNLVESLMTNSDHQPSINSSSSTHGFPLGFLLPEDSESVQFSHFLNNRAVCLYEQGRFQASIHLYEEALAMAERMDSDDDGIEIIRQNLATSYERVGRRADALQIFEAILASRQARYGTDAVETLTPLRMLSIALQSSWDPDSLQRALDYAQRAVDIQASSMNLTTLATARRMFLWLPSTQSPSERASIIEEAKALYNRALELEQQNPDAGLRGQAVIGLGLSTLAQEEERFIDAEALARRSHDILLNDYYDHDHWRVAEAQSVLGGALLGLGNLTEAEPLIEDSLAVLVQTRGLAARPSIEAARRLDLLQEQMGH